MIRSTQQIRLFKHYVAPEAAAMMAETLASGCIGQGPKVDEFERALEPWIGPNVTVNSGTSALWLAYDLAGIKEGDYVISTPMTCLATEHSACAHRLHDPVGGCRPQDGVD